MRYTYQVSYLKENDCQAIVRFYIDAESFDEAEKIAHDKDIALRDSSDFFRSALSTMCRCISISDGKEIFRISDKG